MELSAQEAHLSSHQAQLQSWQAQLEQQQATLEQLEASATVALAEAREAAAAALAERDQVSSAYMLIQGSHPTLGMFDSELLFPQMPACCHLTLA
jgi:CHASE3 domain sensor protein